MTTAASPHTEVRFTPEFKRNLHALSKKYRHIRSDLEPIIERLRDGHRPGDQIPGVAYAVYKVRVRNRDAGKGTRGGYRLLYYVATPTAVILVTVYSKSEQADISAARIRRIIREYDDANL